MDVRMQRKGSREAARDKLLQQERTVCASQTSMGTYPPQHHAGLIQKPVQLGAEKNGASLVASKFLSIRKASFNQLN